MFGGLGMMISGKSTRSGIVGDQGGGLALNLLAAPAATAANGHQTSR